MIQKVNFKQNSLRIFAEILGDLKEVCHPPFERIQPIIRIDTQSDNICSDYGAYTVKELDEAVQKKQILPSHIKFIKMNGIPWFYKEDYPFDFYSMKKHVALDFAPQRLMNPKVLEDKQILNSVKKMLAFLGQKDVSETDAAKFFPENICRKVYELCPPREYIFSGLTNAIERVRRVLFQHLASHHASEIQNLPGFQDFQKVCPNKTLIKFLRKDYKGYSLAEKWGYITNSQKLISFQKFRDIPRHSEKFMPDPIVLAQTGSVCEEDRNRWLYHAGYPYQNPMELYREFQKALSFVTPQKSQDAVSYDDAVCSIWTLKDIEQLKKMLYSLSFKKNMETFLQKNFPEEVSTQTVVIEKPDKTRVTEPVTVFSSFYVRKKGIAPVENGQKQPDGSVLLQEQDFRDWKQHSDTFAHANEGYQQSAKVLSEDMFVLSDFVGRLSESYERKKSSQMQTFRNTSVKQSSSR